MGKCYVLCEHLGHLAVLGVYLTQTDAHVAFNDLCKRDPDGYARGIYGYMSAPLVGRQSTTRLFKVCVLLLEHLRDRYRPSDSEYDALDEALIGLEHAFIAVENDLGEPPSDKRPICCSNRPMSWDGTSTRWRCSCCSSEYRASRPKGGRST